MVQNAIQNKNGTSIYVNKIVKNNWGNMYVKEICGIIVYVLARVIKYVKLMSI